MRLSLFSLLPVLDAASSSDVYEIALSRAALADELGFHGFWIAEHHARALSKMPAPAVFLAAASQRTKRIRLGVAVAVLSVRDPLLAAEEYALVDRLSGGRLDLGVGSGVSPVEFAAFGIEFQEKRSRFDESLRMLRHAWSGEGGEVRGEHRSYGDLFCGVETAQNPSPPIWRAVGSVEGAAAAGADGDAVLFLTAPDLSDHEDLHAMQVAHQQSWVGGENSDRERRVGAALFTTVAPTDSEARSRAVAGFDRMAVARGQQPAGGETVAAIVEGGRGFVGSPETVLGSLQELKNMGVTDALLWLDHGAAPEWEVEESMRLLYSAVAPMIP